MNTTEVLESVKYVKIVDVEFAAPVNDEINTCKLLLREPVSGQEIEIDVTDYLKQKFGGSIKKSQKKTISQMVKKAMQHKSMTKVFKDKSGKYQLLKIDKVFR